MGRDRCVNQRIALPLLQEGLGIAEHGGFILIVGGGKIDKSLAQHSAHAGRLGFFGNRIFEVVHVGEGRDPAANLFCRRQPRSPADEFFGDILGFGGENVFA